MKTRREEAGLSIKAGDAELRASDRGKIKGEFEFYFFDIRLPADLVINQHLCEVFDEKVKHFVLSKKMKETDTSVGLDRMFEKYFRLMEKDPRIKRLPPGKHVTPKIWSEWREKHESIRAEILKKRTLTGRRSTDNDSR